MARRLLVLIVGLTLVMAACGGDDGDASSSAETSAGAEVTVGSEVTAAPTTADSEGAGSTGEVPAFLSDFERVCTTQVGFAGARTYEGGPGVHPVVVFKEGDDEGSFFESSSDLPQGWAVVEDDNFDDNSELAPTELVACIDRTATTPTGVQCDFDSDGEQLTLEVVDAAYDVTVYTATTGEVVGSVSLEASSTDCPMFLFIDEGQTQYVNTLDADDIINALKPYVAPA